MACVYQIQGSRYRSKYPATQDVTIEVSKPGVHIYGLFDGHGRRGLEVATTVARELTGQLLEELNIHENIERINLKIEKIFYDYAIDHKDVLIFQNSGTTVAIAIDIGENIIFCNAGDSSIMWEEPGRPRATVMHVVSYPPEKSRIARFPGVRIEGTRVWSDMHGLEMTRGIGNFSMTPYEFFDRNDFLISPIPTVEIVPKTELYTLTYVLASDGVTDVLDIIDIMDLATLRKRANRLTQGEEGTERRDGSLGTVGVGGPEALTQTGSDNIPSCRYICETALKLGSRDDITAMVAIANPSRTISLVTEKYIADGFRYEPISLREPQLLANELSTISSITPQDGDIFYGDFFNALVHKLEGILGMPIAEYEYDDAIKFISPHGAVSGLPQEHSIMYFNLSNDTYVMDAYTREDTVIAFEMRPGSLMFLIKDGFVTKIKAQSNPDIKDYTHIVLST